ncbi:hypothetical protein BJL95_21280 [Methylomonas sp. LWB]|nr:hypothetical protein BJL95_21280 [Methylomonas sp. LWB]
MAALNFKPAFKIKCINFRFGSIPAFHHFHERSPNIGAILSESMAWFASEPMAVFQEVGWRCQ